MNKADAKKMISHFNNDGEPVFFLAEATPEKKKLIEEAKELHKKGKLKDLFNS